MPYRPLAFGIAAAVLICLHGASAAAEWQEFVFEDLGIAKQFPSAPRRGRTGYASTVAGRLAPADADLFTAEAEQVVYRMTVVDFSAPEKVAKAAIALAECVFQSEEKGTPLANLPLHVDDGTALGVLGRIVTTELEDKSRKETACLFAGGRLHKLEATAPGAAGEPAAAQAAHFMTTLRFLPQGR
jgi:hypothetical protein